MFLNNDAVAIWHSWEGGVTSMEPFLKKFFPEAITKIKQDTKISNYWQI